MVLHVLIHLCILSDGLAAVSIWWMCSPKQISGSWISNCIPLNSVNVITDTDVDVCLCKFTILLQYLSYQCSYFLWIISTSSGNVYLKNYAQIPLCYTLLRWGASWFIHIHQGCFTGTQAIICLKVGNNNTRTGTMLRLCPANERGHYNITSSLIGWVHTQNDPWVQEIRI